MGNKKAIEARQRKQNDIEAIKKRFMARVEIDSITGCWIWIGAAMSTGSYGLFWLRGKTVVAHRAGYEIFVGPIPEGCVLRHACDDKRCVFHGHLTPGTHSENMIDAVVRNRIARGERNGLATLTEEEVARMKAEYVPGRHGDLTRLANKYQQSVQNVSHVLHGRTWQHVQADERVVPVVFPSVKAGSKNSNSKLVEGDVVDMLDAREAGVSIRAIADCWSLKIPQTWAILHRHAWKHVEWLSRRTK